MPSAYLTVNHLSMKDLTRIFSKISIKPDVQWNGTPCWGWAGAHDHKGYGFTFWQTLQHRTHRLLYAWLVAPIPAGRKEGEIDHLCRNHSCCNPAHLEFVTARENVLRGISPAAINASKSHCPRGHFFTKDNIYSYPDGRKDCLICYRARSLKNTKKYQAKYPERVKSQHAKYKAEHRAQYSAYERERCRKNKDRINAHRRILRKAKKEARLKTASDN